MKQFSILIFSVFFLLGPRPSFGQSVNNSQVFEFLNANVNFIKNPYARYNTIDVAVSGATKGRVAGATKFNGIASHTCTSGTVGQYCQPAIRTVTSPYKSAETMCEYSVSYSSTTASDWGLVVGSMQVPFRNTASGEDATAYLTQPCSGTPTAPRIQRLVAGSSNTLEYAIYYGPSTRMGQVQTEIGVTSYTPALGGVTSLNSVARNLPEGKYWVKGDRLHVEAGFRNGTGGAASGTASAYVTLGLPDGFTPDTSKMIPVMSGYRVGGTCYVSDVAGSGTTGTTGAVYISAGVAYCLKDAGDDYAKVSDIGAGTSFQVKFDIPIVEGTSVADIATVNNLNYAPRSYTPTAVNGPGCSSSSFQHSRNGSKMTITGSCTVSSAGGAGILTYSLPPNITTISSPMQNGVFSWFDSGVGFKTGVVNIDANVLKFGIDGGTNYTFGNVFASPDTFSFNITFDAIENGAAWTASAPGTVKVDPPVKKIVRYTAGSGTYTPTPGTKWIEIEMVGGGGGGSGSGTASAGSGTSGGSTTFGTSLLTAGGGAGGFSASTSNSIGGAPTVNSPAKVIVAVNGGFGGGGMLNQATNQSFLTGGYGGVSFFGGNGAPSAGGGGTGTASSGSGGAGGRGDNYTGSYSGAGGAAGAYIRAYIESPAASYSYAVGAGGNGGTAGTSGHAGGWGAAGIIIITEHFTSFESALFSGALASVPGSYTNNSTSPMRIETITFAGAGGQLVACNTTNCTSYGNNTSWANVTAGVAGAYTLNYPGIFSAPPSCTATLSAISGTAFLLKGIEGLSSMALNIYNVSGSLSNGGATITCIGPR